IGGEHAPEELPPRLVLSLNEPLPSRGGGVPHAEQRIAAAARFGERGGGVRRAHPALRRSPAASIGRTADNASPNSQVSRAPKTAASYAARAKMRSRTASYCLARCSM